MLKNTYQDLPVRSQYKFWAFSLCPQRNSVPIKQLLPSPSCPQLPATINLLSKDLSILDISYK